MAAGGPRRLPAVPPASTSARTPLSAQPRPSAGEPTARPFSSERPYPLRPEFDPRRARLRRWARWTHFPLRLGRSPATTPPECIRRCWRRWRRPTKVTRWPTGTTAGRARRGGLPGAVRHGRGDAGVGRQWRQRDGAGLDARPGGGRGLHRVAHINVDETGAPERFVGAKLIDLPNADGKLRPEQVEARHPCAGRRAPRAAGRRLDHSVDRDRHAVHRRGGRALADMAHRYGMSVHLDGARIANAAAALAVGRPVVHGRRRRRRDVLRRHQERDDVRRGRRLPRPDLGPARQVRPQAGRPVPVEDALRRRPVRGSPRRRPVAAQRRPRQRHGDAPLRPRPRQRRRRPRRPARGQQPVPPPPPAAIEPLQAWCAFYDWDPPSTRCAG